jgi:hypothetical protein
MPKCLSSGVVLLAALGCSKPEPHATGRPVTAPCSSASSDSSALACLEDAGLIPTLDRGAGIAGPDTDGNGIRDDLDGFISAQSYSADQQKAVKQLARACQAAVVATA